MDVKRGLGRMARRLFAPAEVLKERYLAFRKLLRSDGACLTAMAELEDAAAGVERPDWERVVLLCERTGKFAEAAAGFLSQATQTDQDVLMDKAVSLRARIRALLPLTVPDPTPPYAVPLLEAARKPELYGGKAAGLGAVLAAGLPAPGGFAVSVGGYRYFLEHNRLGPAIKGLLSQATLSRPRKLKRLCDRMRALILAAEVPPSLLAELARAARAIADAMGESGGLLAVRSSAVAEDGEFSFAGQYESLLGIAPEHIGEAYKSVLAGKYRTKAVAYRMAHGFADEETPMAVLILPMIRARAAGVAYSLDPGFSQGRTRAVGVYAVAGLGDALVGGASAPMRRYLSRTGDGTELAAEDDETGSPDGPAMPEIGPDDLAHLAELALTLESLFRSPQDVEWAIGQDGAISILQSRSLRACPAETPGAPDLEGSPGSHGAACLPDAPGGPGAQDGSGADLSGPDISGETALLEGGLRVSAGAASGRVFHADGPVDPESVPKGAILCAPSLPPSLSLVAGRVGAVVAETGSRAGHFASIAREYGLPVLVGAKDACRLLPEGAPVTVDADAGTVYQGRVDALLVRRRKPAGSGPSPLDKRLAAIMPLISPLSLTDPDSEAFTPENAASLHDVVRYAHEVSVRAMFSLGEYAARGMGRAKKIRTVLPVSAYLLDLGGALDEAGGNKSEIEPADMRSLPLKALWRGLESEEAIWIPGMIHMDWEGFDRLSAGILPREPRELATHALAARSYAHLLLRFGYHFAVADAFCNEEDKNNYAAFRFKGGGGSPGQRALRMDFIDRVLVLAGFETSRASDMLEARFARRSVDETLGRLCLLGALMARTRLMDAALSGDADLESMARAFLEGRPLSLTVEAL